MIITYLSKFALINTAKPPALAEFNRVNLIINVLSLKPCYLSFEFKIAFDPVRKF